ncbi:methyltransferase domain-containing protein [Rhizobium sp. CFBP 8762]|uniref:class I SAM-dependent methyltransferase n=1 Tax=Rhizobium sp. CFBP 8762 TaxID=2775279 RepID=UPI00177F25A9|nr:class I SAM-dependent methyltransferase [Rhizobium sp. CFBP 8762]MBD8555128.1 methyltransferase domain-containing protein [Rhizobium sp. CFBP 8762]
MSDTNKKMAFTGERFVPEETGNIVIEHLHRYYSALPLVVGKTVLDIASGEGYGSDLLASCAMQVYGVDIAPEAVQHARDKYARTNLKFIVGSCASIPLPDHSVDVIVSFETLEHHDQHEESMSEFKRVLRPDGTLFISSPDKKNYSDLRDFRNPFHVRELYEEEFHNLLQRHFRQIHFFSQRIAFGSFLLPASGSAKLCSYLLRDGNIISSPGVVEPYYHLALASDAPLVTIEGGVFEQPINDTEVIQSWERVMAERDRELDGLRQEAEQLFGENARLSTERILLAEQNKVLAEKNDRLAAQSKKLIEENAGLTRHSKELTEKYARLLEQSKELGDANARLATQSNDLNEQLAHLFSLKQKFKDLLQERDADNHELERLKDAYDNEKRRFDELTTMTQTIFASKSWTLTAPLRASRRRLESLFGLSNLVQPISRSILGLRSKNALNYLRRRDLSGFVGRLRHYRRETQLEVIQQNLSSAEGRIWGILTTPHTLFIAQCMVERLALHGINTVVMTEAPSSFNNDLYIVLCAQMFERLPPGEKRVIFQLEQSVSSRWFTPGYLSMLENSLAVLEYSLVNIDFLTGKGIAYPHVFYLPIGTSLEIKDTLPSAQKEYDFLFYGDYYSSPRRAKMIDALQAQFQVKLCNNAFGEEMHALIRKARVVINIHYYENALLEMPRIQECLSQGVPVVSESAQDQEDYPELAGAVHFFEEGSIEEMLRVAESTLQAASALEPEVVQATAKSAHRFTFMFDRFLTSLGVLPPDTILNDEIYLPNTYPQIALSLPETIKRRRLFQETKPPLSCVFDGIRNVKGWIGCGSSYSALARHAQRNGLTELTVFEDDAVFREDHLERLRKIRVYLESTNGWDIFSGMIASVHNDTRILDVQEVDGLTFVKLDRMTSMVFNIYNRRAIDLMVQWDPTNNDVDSNAIDRYLENQVELKTVVTLPFLVGHREEMMSTLWGIQNDHYSKMIDEAESKIRQLSYEWLSVSNHKSL